MASRFWVGNGGTWDAADTAHWAATSGGAGGQTVPGSSDTVTIDAASGTGTITVNTTVTVQSITCGEMAMTLDFGANDNNVTLTTGFSGSGSGARTINLGDGLWTISGTGGGAWTMATVTNLVAFNCNGSTITMTGAGATFAGGGRTYNTVNFNNGRSGVFTSGSNTFATLNIGAPNFVVLTNGTTTTVTNAFTWTGTGANPIHVTSANNFAIATISVAAGSPTAVFSSFREITFSGGATFSATNSFDLGGNTGITISGPSSGGGARVIGG